MKSTTLKKNPIAVMPSGIVINRENMDSEDIQLILSETRAIPLSDMEKKYIDEMHYSLTLSLEYMKDILSIVDSGKDVKDYEYIDDMRMLVKQADGIVNIEADALGRGFEFITKESNE